ncbi:MAG: oligosaccharide flippase family protein [Gemmatimonadaceae bacterium]|nr:oligosaccharide flippase family protein [Gemmatimonadaceae bacterium]
MSGLLRRSSHLAIGTAVGQGLVVLASAVLARVYGPAEFGALALLMTVTALGSTAGAARLDVAIPSADDGDVAPLVTAAALVAAGAASAVALGVWLLPRPEWLAPLRDTASLPVLLGTGVFLAAMYQVAGAYLLRLHDTRHVGLMRAAQGAVFATAAFSTAIGLLWAHALAFGVGLIGLVSIARTVGRTPLTSTPSRTALGATLREHWRLPALSLPGALCDALAVSQCVWIISDVFGSTQLGIYGQTQRLLGAPLLLASASLGQVLLRRTAELRDDPAGLEATLSRVLRGMLAASAVGLAVLAVVGPDAFALLLGERWRPSLTMLLAVGVAVASRATVSPLSSVLVTYRRYGLTFAWQAAYLLSSAIVLRLISTRTTFDGFMIAFAAHEAVAYVVYLLLIRRAVAGAGPATAASTVAR